MTDTNELCTPWSLHFDRDGTEDFGIICDAEGSDLVASHLPCTARGERTFQSGTFWLPEYDGDPVPLLVRQMRLMTAAPKLLEMLKVAVATADRTDHGWVQEASEVIEEATGLRYREREAEGVRHLHRAAQRIYAALEACEKTVREFREFANAVDLLLHDQDPARIEEIEAVRKEAFAALCDARGEIAF